MYIYVCVCVYTRNPFLSFQLAATTRYARYSATSPRPVLTRANPDMYMCVYICIHVYP